MIKEKQRQQILDHAIEEKQKQHPHIDFSDIKLENMGDEYSSDIEFYGDVDSILNNTIAFQIDQKIKKETENKIISDKIKHLSNVLNEQEPYVFDVLDKYNDILKLDDDVKSREEVFLLIEKAEQYIKDIPRDQLTLILFNDIQALSGEKNENSMFFDPTRIKRERMLRNILENPKSILSDMELDWSLVNEKIKSQTYTPAMVSSFDVYNYIQHRPLSRIRADFNLLDFNMSEYGEMQAKFSGLTALSNQSSDINLNDMFDTKKFVNKNTSNYEQLEVIKKLMYLEEKIYSLNVFEKNTQHDKIRVTGEDIRSFYNLDSLLLLKSVCYRDLSSFRDILVENGIINDLDKIDAQIESKEQEIKDVIVKMKEHNDSKQNNDSFEFILHNDLASPKIKAILDAELPRKVINTQDNSIVGRIKRFIGNDNKSSNIKHN